MERWAAPGQISTNPIRNGGKGDSFGVIWARRREIDGAGDFIARNFSLR